MSSLPKSYYWRDWLSYEVSQQLVWWHTTCKKGQRHWIPTSFSSKSNPLFKLNQSRINLILFQIYDREPIKLLLALVLIVPLILIIYMLCYYIIYQFEAKSRKTMLAYELWKYTWYLTFQDTPGILLVEAWAFCRLWLPSHSGQDGTRQFGSLSLQRLCWIRCSGFPSRQCFPSQHRMLCSQAQYLGHSGLPVNKQTTISLTSLIPVQGWIYLSGRGELA